jgi:hypothetical protein
MAVRILLLDMDGVLLEPHGYDAALSESVGQVSQALGFPRLTLTDQDIDVIEAAGITCEWEIAAICHALLLTILWRRYPDFTLSTAPPLPQAPQHELPLPDIQRFFQNLGDTQAGQRTMQLAEEILANNGALTAAQRRHLQSILRNPYTMQCSLTHRLIQELTLGSEDFRKAYGIPPYHEGPGTLHTLDRPTLSPPAQKLLRSWLREAGHSAAVMTSRPSIPPQDFFSTPEAEIGLQVAGLPGIPIVGHGCLSWLSAMRHAPIPAFLKPSPVHALAALRKAIGGAPQEALLSAAALDLDKKMDAKWKDLDGTRVDVLEDSVKGLRSASAAADILAQNGICIRVCPYGVANTPHKALALRQDGATVFPELEQALTHAGVLP